MALSQDDRISISKKVVDIPKEDAISLDNKAKLEKLRVKSQKIDDANKSLFDDKNVLINSYQNELKRLDGNDKTEIIEQDIVDTANNKLGNFFSPNQLSTPTPSLPDGVWKQFPPFSGNKALGKNYLEVFPAVVTKENDKISTLNNVIGIMESYSPIQRSTGQICNSGGTCSLPAYTTQSTCVGAIPTPGIWTSGPDIISNDPIVQNTATSLISEVENWKLFLQASIPFITAIDSNTTRQNENNIAIADINNSISIINVWLTRSTFDTSHGQTTCIGFNSYDVNLLSATKFRSNELQLLKNEITDRVSFITTRINQIGTNLGSITQDLSTGILTSTTGLYGQRMNILDLRLNLINGSLRKLENIKLGKKSQDQAIASNASAKSVYTSVLTVSAFSAPSLGSTIIHVKDTSDFSLSDNVYVASDTQQEISTVIVAISENMITLAKSIPSKYRQNENARIYKVI